MRGEGREPGLSGSVGREGELPGDSAQLWLGVKTADGHQSLALAVLADLPASEAADQEVLTPTLAPGQAPASRGEPGEPVLGEDSGQDTGQQHQPPDHNTLSELITAGPISVVPHTHILHSVSSQFLQQEANPAVRTERQDTASELFPIFISCHKNIENRKSFLSVFLRLN